MVSIEEIKRLNRELGDKINEEALRDPQSPYAGKYVGIADGKVVVVTEDLDELAEQLRQAEPEIGKRYWIEASRDYSQIEYIWEAS